MKKTPSHLVPSPLAAALELRSAALLVSCLALPALGCGGAQGPTAVEEDNQDAGDDAGFAQAFDGFEPVALEGLRFVPQALGRPGMPKVTPNKKTSIKSLRRKIKRKHSQEEAQVLASMLWHESTDPEAGMKEAHELLRSEKDAAGDKVDPVTLQMLGAAEAWAKNDAGLAAAYQEIVDRFPKAEGLTSFKAWLAYLHMQADRDDEAAKLVDGWTAEAAGPVGAYALSWVKFRQGDLDGAVKDITYAAENWNGGVNANGVLKRDLLLMHARAGAPVAVADALLAKLIPEGRANVLFELAEGYRFAGYYKHAADTLEHIITKVSPGDQLPRENYVPFRFRQSDFAARQNLPDRAADLAIEAHKGLASCDKCSPAVKNAVNQNLSNLGVFYHTTYHSTLDQKYYAPAEKLYQYVGGLGTEKSEEAKTNLDNLKNTKERINMENGKHDQNNLRTMIMLRREVVKACYEAELLKNGALQGTLSLTLRISDSGAVSGASTEPAEGAEGLAAVATCVIARSKSWAFPGRTVAGTTKVTQAYTLKPQVE